MGKGLENGVFKDFGSRAKNVMYVSGGMTSKPHNGFPSGRRIRLALEDLDALENNISEINRIAPRLEIGASTIAYKDRNDEFEVRGELTGFDKDRSTTCS